MKNGKVTIQDIADTLKLSRNTVSKALNGQHVPPKTKNLVLNAAIEMGYKSYKSIASADSVRTHKRIALVTSRFLLNINYYIYIMRGIELTLEDKDIELLQFTVTNATTFRKLTDFLAESKIDGILCIELFKNNYLSDLIALGYPLVSLDFPALNLPINGKFDLVMPESFRCTRAFCMQLIKEKGCTTFGFVGDYLHCHSFYERFLGMREALFMSNIPFEADYGITLSEDDLVYANPYALYEVISKRQQLPKCFVCANEAIAIALIEALKRLRKRVPKDCLVIGFDNVPESKNNEPALTTFNVDKVALGKRLLSVLLDRIEFPAEKNRTLYVESRLIAHQTT